MRRRSRAGARKLFVGSIGSADNSFDWNDPSDDESPSNHYDLRADLVQRRATSDLDRRDDACDDDH